MDSGNWRNGQRYKDRQVDIGTHQHANLRSHTARVIRSRKRICRKHLVRAVHLQMKKTAPMLREPSDSVAAGAFAIIAYVAGRPDYTAYLGIPHVPHAGELAIGHVRYSTTGSNAWENSQPVQRAAGSAGKAAGACAG